MRLKPVLSTRMPMNGLATNGTIYTMLLTKPATEELNPYFDVRNVLGGILVRKRQINHRVVKI